MFFTKNNLKLVQNLLLISIIIVIFEFCVPHYAFAQENPTSMEIGPVGVVLKADDNMSLHPEINNLPELADRQPKYVRWVTMTAYSSTVDQCDDTPFITANGSYVYDGLVAANFLPFGTKIRIPDYFGDKVFTVEDRMNKKYNSRVDVWMGTREQAKQFGARYLKIEVY
jgi:3D (Asp-Asp-Asp) domain-containing protein